MSARDPKAGWLAVLGVLAIGGVLMANRSLPPTPRLTLAQTLGRGVIGYRAAVNISQDSLARVMRSGRWPLMTAARLSQLERGLVAASPAEALALKATLDSLAAARLDPAGRDSLSALSRHVFLFPRAAP